MGLLLQPKSSNHITQGENPGREEVEFAQEVSKDTLPIEQTQESDSDPDLPALSPDEVKFSGDHQPLQSATESETTSIQTSDGSTAKVVGNVPYHGADLPLDDDAAGESDVDQSSIGPDGEIDPGQLIR